MIQLFGLEFLIWEPRSWLTNPWLSEHSSIQPSIALKFLSFVILLLLLFVRFFGAWIKAFSQSPSIDSNFFLMHGFKGLIFNIFFYLVFVGFVYQNCGLVVCVWAVHFWVLMMIIKIILADFSEIILSMISLLHTLKAQFVFVNSSLVWYFAIIILLSDFCSVFTRI